MDTGLVLWGYGICPEISIKMQSACILMPTVDFIFRGTLRNSMVDYLFCMQTIPSSIRFNPLHCQGKVPCLKPWWSATGQFKLYWSRWSDSIEGRLILHNRCSQMVVTKGWFPHASFSGCSLQLHYKNDIYVWTSNCRSNTTGILSHCLVNMRGSAN